MRTVDVRVLVRAARHPTRDILDQLVAGTLRVHGAVELIPDPRRALPNGVVNSAFGRAVAVPPVHQNPRMQWQPEVREWRGDVVVHDPTRYTTERRALAARFATQEATRAGAVDELVQTMTDVERIARVRAICEAALNSDDRDLAATVNLAATVLAALDGAR